MKKVDIEKYDCIITIIITILFFITFFLYEIQIISNCEYKEIIDTTFLYKRDTIIILPYQNIEDIKNDLQLTIY